MQEEELGKLAGGMEEEIYSAEIKHLPFCSHWLYENHCYFIHLFSAHEILPECHGKGGGGLWGRTGESFTRQAVLIYDSRGLH